LNLKSFKRLFYKLLLPTKVFAKAGLDNVTSALCKHQQQFGLDVQNSALVHNFNFSFSIGHLYRADEQRIPRLRKYSNVSGQAVTTVPTKNGEAENRTE